MKPTGPVTGLLKTDRPRGAWQEGQRPSSTLACSTARPLACRWAGL